MNRKKTNRYIIGVLAIFLAIMVLANVGCATFGLGTSEECTVYADIGATAENSVICSLIDDPCLAQRILATAAKAPVIWKPEYVGMFDVWAGKVQEIIDTGLSYQALQDMIVVQIATINREAGLALLLVSDGIFVFNGHTELIGEIDKKLLLMSLEDLRAQVKRMAILAG